ncbi:MAG: hypothetical protein IPQ17_07210 [Xanthomonadales bacterium]|nr:hypothetical protein [Xanthomonadales bacterium]
MQWYLQQVCSYQAAHGVRLVDYLDLHYYPQGDGVVDFSDPPNGSETAIIAARRLRSLKELNDSAWDSESWLSDLGNSAPWHYSRPNLIPRVRAWIDASCQAPACRSASTTGGGRRCQQRSGSGRSAGHLCPRRCRHGGTLGGARDRVLVERAFRLYLDFDGGGGHVSGHSTRASSASIDALGAYAIHQPGAHVMLLLFNKATTATTAAVNLGTHLSGPWQLYQFGGSNDIALVASGTLDGTRHQPGESPVAIGKPADPAPIPIASLPTASISASRHVRQGVRAWRSVPLVRGCGEQHGSNEGATPMPRLAIVNADRAAC